jgi:hypothetical protein
LDHSLAPPFELGARNWRKLTLVLGAVAAPEAIVILVAAVVLLSPSDSHRAAPNSKAGGKAGSQASAGKPRLTPAQTAVMVLNGNGQSGAAATTAGTVRGLGYRIGPVGNAPRMDYPVSLVMYRPGFRPEALGFARRVHVRTVGPLDGIRLRKLGRAKIVYIVGTS